MRLTVNLSQENYELLRRIAQGTNTSLSEALNRLLANRPEPKIETGPDGRPLVVGAERVGPVDSHDVDAEEDRRQAALAGFPVR
ncbi:MAG: hypothetical protein SFW67_37610 [Myxococcaceae bacterium]|nr:hypothetical protein [Myxococcaceae bacterium]